MKTFDGKITGFSVVRKPSSSVCYTPSSEPYRIYLYNRYGPGIYPSFRKLQHLKIQLAKTLNYIVSQSENPVILCVIHHRQNPIESI
jgi:hypothetical protein